MLINIHSNSGGAGVSVCPSPHQHHRLHNNTFPCIDSCVVDGLTAPPADSFKLKPVKVECWEVGARVRC